MLGRDRLRLLEGGDDAANRLVPRARACAASSGLDHARVGVRVRDDDDLGRPARQVDRHVAGDLELRVVHVRVPGPDDLVDPADVREPRDRLRPAERPHLVDPERRRRGRDQARCPGRHRSDGFGDVVSAGPVSGHPLFEHLAGGPWPPSLFWSAPGES